MQRKFEYVRVNYHCPYDGNENFTSFYMNDEKKSRPNINANKFWDDMGKDGWELKGYSVDPKTFHFAIFQREIF